MGSRKGIPNKITVAVKDAVERAFNTVNHDGQYLIGLAASDPKTFMGVVAKCIPSAVAVSVIHEFNLGAEMRLAQQNMERLDAADLSVIEHKPDTPITLNEQETTKPLKVKGKT